jgi:hypothetical protein
MRSSHLLKLVLGLLVVTLPACGAIEAQRQEAAQKQVTFEQHMDITHIFVTPDEAPAGKPYHVLGDLSYTEHINTENVAEAIDAHKMNAKLKEMANEKFPGAVDAVVKAHSDVSADATAMTVTGQAIQFESSADREAMHHMNEGMVASPSGN